MQIYWLLRIIAYRSVDALDCDNSDVISIVNCTSSNRKSTCVDTIPGEALLHAPVLRSGNGSSFPAIPL